MDDQGPTKKQRGGNNSKLQTFHPEDDITQDVSIYIPEDISNNTSSLNWSLTISIKMLLRESRTLLVQTFVDV